jgi:hypothetical protein
MWRGPPSNFAENFRSFYQPDLLRHSLTRSALTFQHLSPIRTSITAFGRYHHSCAHCGKSLARRAIECRYVDLYRSNDCG